MAPIIRLAPALLALVACTVPEKISPDDVDPDEPQTFIERAPPAYAPRANELRFTADREATFVCGVDGAVPEPCASPFPLVLGDGPHLFSVAAVANGRRDQTPATAAWVVDSVPPGAYFTLTPPSAIADTHARFEFQATADEVVTFECRLDGTSDFACDSPLSLEVGEGLHSLRVTAIDRAGLRDDDAPLCAWTADTTRPVVSFFSGPMGLVRSTAASFVLEVSEPNLTLSCRLDGGAAGPCSNPVDLANLAQGTHSLVVTAVDRAGNSTVGPVVWTWTVDTVPPQFSMSQMLIEESVYGFSLTTTEPDVAFICSLDGAPFLPCNPEHSLNAGPGTHSYAAIAQDVAGNSSAELRIDWTQ